MGTKYDMPDNYYFGGTGDSYVTPLALVMLLVATVLFFALPRKYVIVAFLASGIVLPTGVRLIIGGVHFPAERILLLMVWGLPMRANVIYLH